MRDVNRIRRAIHVRRPYRKGNAGDWGVDGEPRCPVPETGCDSRVTDSAHRVTGRASEMPVQQRPTPLARDLLTDVRGLDATDTTISGDTTCVTPRPAPPVPC